MSDGGNLHSATVVARVGRSLGPFLAQHSVQIEELAPKVGLDVKDFEDIDARVDLERFCRLMDISATLTGMEDFGIQYSSFYETGNTGAFAQGLLAAPNLKELMIFFARYVETVVDLHEFELIIEKHHVTAEWSYSPLIKWPGQFTDFLASQTVNVIFYITENKQKFRKFEFKRAAPQGKTQHHVAFPGPITFGSHRNYMELGTEHLQKPNPLSNPVVFELMTRECEAKLKAAYKKRSLPETIRASILEDLPNGVLPLSSAASKLGMSARTLQRRLAKDDLTYDSLVEELRFGLIETMLSTTNTSLGRVANASGYSDQSAFTRAVARRYGETPTQLRRRLKEQAN